LRELIGKFAAKNLADKSEAFFHEFESEIPRTAAILAAFALPPKQIQTRKGKCMKVMSTFSVRPGCMKEAASRFLAGQAAPPPGLTLLGRWHKSDGSGGFALFETDNPAVAYEQSMRWADVLETHSNVVIEDAEAGMALAKVFGQ